LDSDGLKFVNLFEENALVFELVTLRKHVKGVVDVLVNFLRVSEFLQHTTKDSLTTHPQNLEGKTGVGSTSTLTDTCVSSLSLGLVSQADASTGVHNGGLLDNKTIPFQTRDVTARIGQGNFVGLVRIQPNFAPSTFQDGCRKAFLKTKID